LVRLGQEYVYQPGIGDAGRGATPDNDQIVQSELEILSSAALTARVIHDIGYARLFPAKAKAYDTANALGHRKLEAEAIKSLESSLKIVTAPDNAVVRLTFSGKDPEVAALFLNTLIDEYLVYRRTVLVGGEGAALIEQRRMMEDKLHAADQAYSQFLADNHIGDLDTEKASLAAAFGQLTAESYSVQAQLSESEGSLSRTSSLVKSAPPEIGLYHDLDHSAGDRLNLLRLERQEMASRYQPGSLPLREKDNQIAALEALMRNGATTMGGARRVGVNPVWQTLETERNQMDARAASLRSRKAAIQHDLQELTAKRQHLAALEPQYQALMRDREILSGTVKALAGRTEELFAQQALSGKSADNIRVVERAFVPAKGTSLKAPIMAASILFAGFTALCAGLIGVFLTRGYPSRASFERALGVPVLAATPVIA
jgi:uncharacterized protein involved in exopolysaccharide biosynthesis